MEFFHGLIFSVVSVFCRWKDFHLSINASTSGSFTVNQPFLIQATFTNVNASCSQANGSARVNPVGGVPGYSYLWSYGSTTRTNAPLVAGTYIVTVTDFKFCIRSFFTVVTGTTSPSIDSAQVTNLLFNADTNGVISVCVS